MVPAPTVARHFAGLGINRPLDPEHGCRLHLCESPPLGARRKRGAKAQAIGPSRGGQTTKIHVLTDLLGRPAIIRLSAGNVSDVRAADDLLSANALRKRLRADGVKPIIPGRINRKRTIRYDEKRYKDRWRIEAAFCRLKDFRRVATRYDKLAVNFLSAVALATIIAFWI